MYIYEVFVSTQLQNRAIQLLKIVILYNVLINLSKKY